jgi:hypothetical protein
MDVVEGLSMQRPCAWDCHRTLTLEQRIRAIECIYHCDDALRGWGYEPLYDLHGDVLWREAQRANDPGYRKVAVRFGECIYRRLVGGVIHEVLHALFGDTSQANYGLLFGLPYCVPAHVPEAEEEAYLAPFNFAEARAFVGVWILGPRRFGVDWDARTARDVGTYCFKGGNALVTCPAPGYRSVAHIDPVHHAERYLRRARTLEEEARAWFTEENLAAAIAAIDEAAEKGRSTRGKRYPPAETIARVAPRKPGRNEPCPCGSGKKFKACGHERELEEPPGQALR